MKFFLYRRKLHFKICNTLYRILFKEHRTDTKYTEKNIYSCNLGICNKLPYEMHRYCVMLKYGAKFMYQFFLFSVLFGADSKFKSRIILA